jgi:hypothetical protein
MLNTQTIGSARREPRNTSGIAANAMIAVTRSPNGPDKRIPAATRDKLRHALRTSSPGVALNAKGGLEQESVAVEGVEAMAGGKVAPRQRRSPYSR